MYNVFFRFPALLFSVPARVIVGASVLTLVAAGGGRVRRRPSRRARAAGRGHATGGAGALSPTVLETPLGRAAPRQRRTHGAAQRHPPSAARGRLGLRHRLRRGDSDDRLRLHRCHRAADSDAVLGGRAAGRHRQLRRAARATRHGTRWRACPASLPSSRSAAWPSASARATASGTSPITGVPPNPRFRRIVDRNGSPIRLPPSGVVLSLMLANVLGVAAGRRRSRSKCSKGHRPVRRVEVTGLVDDILGLSAYMDVAALHQMMREGDVCDGRAAAGRFVAGGAAVGGAEGNSRHRGRRLQARHPSELPRDDGRRT